MVPCYFISLSFIMLFMVSHDALCQCPPNDGCGDWSSIENTNLTTIAPGCTAQIEYRTRMCNGILEYTIEKILYAGFCEDLRNIDVEQYHYSGAIDYLTMALIYRDLIHTTIPPCSSSDRVERIHVYTASCGIWVGCEYTVDPDSRQCDQGYGEPFPDYRSGGTTKVKMYKWQPCGTTCCRRIYSICSDPLRPSLPTLLRAILLSKERLTECSGQHEYGNAQNCLDGC